MGPQFYFDFMLTENPGAFILQSHNKKRKRVKTLFPVTRTNELRRQFHSQMQAEIPPQSSSCHPDNVRGSNPHTSSHSVLPAGHQQKNS